MNALFYLVICFFTGYVICSFLLTDFWGMTKTTFRGKYIGINPTFLTLPISFLIGTIIVTWTVYIFALLFRKAAEPLVYANGVTLCIFLIFSVLGLMRLYFSKRETLEGKLGLFAKIRVSEGIFLSIVILLSIQLMWRTFFVEHNQLYVGNTVFSDFSPHIGMIRSFSKGNNFPTMYSHFTGADIRYHFMYQFLVGNLEFLGMRLDYAMNIPSAVGLISSFLLLFILAVKMSGNRAVGYLSCIFFAFRSSKSFFTFLSQIPKGTSIWEGLRSNLEYLTTNHQFLGYTTNENWGLWNLNVYCNQRHLAFTIPILLFVLILFLPSVYSSFTKLYEGMKQFAMQEDKPKSDLFLAKVKYVFIFCFFTKESWRVQNAIVATVAGFLVGALAFWNGAVTITMLLILFVLAIISTGKLDYLITAVIALSLSSLQSFIFIQGSVVDPRPQFGFIAENKTLFGSIDYMIRLTGILPLLLILAFLVVKRARRYVMIAFLAPFVFAFTVSLTNDITVNHKYIMLSLMLLSIFAAICVVKLFSAKGVLMKIISIGFILAMTATGIYDYVTLIARNNPKNSLVLNLESNLTKWVIQNTSAKDTILSSYYYLNEIVLGGGMLYYGWPYYSWSAGYDTSTRELRVKEMFEADSPELLTKLIEENNIRFIVVDRDCRYNESYEVNEDNIQATYQAVYQQGQGEWKLTIYDTELLVGDT